LILFSFWGLKITIVKPKTQVNQSMPVSAQSVLLQAMRDEMRHYFEHINCTFFFISSEEREKSEIIIDKKEQHKQLPA
jgi:hypothetical protein